MLQMLYFFMQHLNLISSWTNIWYLIYILLLHTLVLSSREIHDINVAYRNVLSSMKNNTITRQAYCYWNRLE